MRSLAANGTIARPRDLPLPATTSSDFIASAGVPARDRMPALSTTAMARASAEAVKNLKAEPSSAARCLRPTSFLSFNTRPMDERGQGLKEEHMTFPARTFEKVRQECNLALLSWLGAGVCWES
jgi:hypothetical protein